MIEVMLTTIDNPFDPFTDWDNWFQFDESKGYNTCGYLARIVKSSDDLTELEESEALNDAIDEIIEFNPLGIYKKVTKT